MYTVPPKMHVTILMMSERLSSAAVKRPLLLASALGCSWLLRAAWRRQKISFR